jgi:hypothetical protein
VQDPGFVRVTTIDYGGTTACENLLHLMMPRNTLYLLVWSLVAAGGVRRWLSALQASAPGADVLLVCSDSVGLDLQQTIDCVQKEAVEIVR